MNDAGQRIRGRQRPQSVGPPALTALSLAALSVATLAGASAVGCAPGSPAGSSAVRVPAVVIDGEFDDWEGIEPAVLDPADVEPVPGATEGDAVDVRAVRAFDDPTAVYLRVDFEGPVNLKGLGGQVLLLFDADGDAATGWAEHGLEGVDLVLEMSPRSAARPELPGFGVAVRTEPTVTAVADGGWPRGRVSSYAVGFLMAPTASGATYELRLERGRPIFAGDRFRLRIVPLAADGTVGDETAILEHALAYGAVPLAPGAAGPVSSDPLARPPDRSLRVVSWNVARTALVENSAAFRRILAALDPDLVLLDEVAGDVDAEWIADVLSSSATSRPGPWHVVVGSGGGDERGVVASRWPSIRLESLNELRYEDGFVDAWLAGIADAEERRVQAQRLARTLSVVGARVDVEGLPLLAVAFDLACCGNRLDGPEERRRRYEAARVRSAILETLAADGYRGVVLGGDLNLVGTRRPLEILLDGTAPLGERLVAVNPLQLDGISNATWARLGDPFPPGRLDFQLHSPSSLEVIGAFVFEAADLAPVWRQHYGLAVGDSDASDHRPVVVDYRIRRLDPGR